ncbi:nicotinate-nucleotide--dimethylbenzimidazole phosphoribosyltransferase [Hydrogenophaga sp. BPS33]|uniref:nicotinate-nucleotide--dimethylbenzimidazole phosphoribosyltransferase n=1 Tax=Hydrogenophaga sp. BPS33 TaxID=2651974 RepID=UPI00131F87D3|nr:nicotinate-nucleotide--dimethylbenzimidazole phosphoribosyltransferase [Hydrogenophaga sp. BPS33]QHE88036.1 nicotinate-nucleotide--dimethylbenzimidazole phosphoribosyltransferase [Hydrogenophaga sp. BPS33]
MALDPVFEPITRRVPELPAELKLPHITPTHDTMLDHTVRQRLMPDGFPEHVLGRMEQLVLQLARIQHGSPLPFDLLAFDSPQLVVFAADHGIADEGMSHLPQSMTCEHVMQLLLGAAPVSALAQLHGFDVTVVDAGVASHIALPEDARRKVPLLLRKIGYGTRNQLLGPAMSQMQAISALHAGMDVVRHLPGNVIALGDVGVANTVSASLLLTRLCGVPLADACGRDDFQGESLSDIGLEQRIEKLSAAAGRHRKALGPLDSLAALGGFEIAMMTGAILQAASERRVVLVDGYVAGAAALVARGLVPAAADYLVFSHRSGELGHRLMLIHLQAQPLLDLGMRLGQGTGALMAWPLLLAAQALLER